MNISNKDEFAAEIEKDQFTNLFYKENCDALYEYFAELMVQLSSGMKDVSELKKEVNDYDIYIYIYIYLAIGDAEKSWDIRTSVFIFWREELKINAK